MDSATLASSPERIPLGYLLTSLAGLSILTPGYRCTTCQGNCRLDVPCGPCRAAPRGEGCAAPSGGLAADPLQGLP